MPAYRLPFLALSALVAATGIHPALRAQTVTTPSGRRVVQVPATGRLHDQLERMRYNADQRGPLICIAPEMQMNNTVPVERALPAHNEPGPTPLMLADAFERRLFTAGSVTALAPREMSVINTNPSKANPLADMQPNEVLSVFMGTLSESQWQKLGSSGLGLGDLNRDQAALMRQMLPRVSAVRPNKAVVSPDKPNETSYEDAGEPITVNPEQFRLRLSRVASYMFSREDKQGGNYITGPYHQPQNGERIWNAEYSGNPDGRDRKSAFGVKIIQTEPNHLKQGELDFAAPVLDAAVALDASDDMPLKTVGDLLLRVQKATHLELQVDRRLGGLPLYVRASPGQTVRAGDILMAVAYSVTGAYRRLGPRLFLLTDDAEGIGTRFARLSAWASAANLERQMLLAKYQKETAKQKPLRFLGFSAGYNTLPPDISKKVEDAWHKERYSQGVQLPVSSLPQDVQKDVESARQVWANMREPIYLSKEQVTISMAAKAQWVMPNGATIEAPGGLSDFNTDTLRNLAASDDAPSVPTSTGDKFAAPKTDAPLPSPFPPTLTRRIIVLAPTTETEARQLVSLARDHGFTEVWLRQSLDNPDFPLLKAAVAAAKPLKMPVVAVAPLLQGHKGADEDRTILGMTGTQWAEDQIKQQKYFEQATFNPVYARQTQRYGAWISPPAAGQENLLAKRLLGLAAIPGVAGICVTGTTPPGYGEKSQYDDGLMAGSELGYTLPQRIGFLSQNGYDPVDLIQSDWSLNVDKDLPFFNNEWSSRYKQVGDNWVVDTAFVPPVDQWKQYRIDQVHRYLAALHGAFRAAQPKLPLYIDDRASSYGSPNLSWYGTWDSAARLPNNPMYADTSTGVGAAHAASSTIFLRVGWQQPPSSPDEGIRFAEMLRRVAKQAEQTNKPWAGMVLDVSDLETKDVSRLLGALPRADHAKTLASRQAESGL